MLAAFSVKTSKNLSMVFDIFGICTLNSLSIQINHQPDATIFQFIILTFIYSPTCFGRSSTHHQELNDCSSSLWFYLRIVVIAMLCSWLGWPKTCWAVNKCQDNKLKNCCIWLVIYLNCMMMHGLTNLKLNILCLIFFVRGREGGWWW